MQLFPTFWRRLHKWNLESYVFCTSTSALERLQPVIYRYLQNDEICGGESGQSVLSLVSRISIDTLQRVAIAGGSRGLGKSMGIELAKRGKTDGREHLSCDADFHTGAHILLLARGKDGLELAKKEVLSNRKSEAQLVDTIALDLCDPVAVRALATNSAKFML
jgi:hypothetical protein